MSIGVGVGDMVLLLQAIKTGYDKYKNAPAEVKDAVRDVSGMYAGLTYIEKTYPLDDNEFVNLYTKDVYVYRSPSLFTPRLSFRLMRERHTHCHYTALEPPY
jgi:hypothetical protein